MRRGRERSNLRRMEFRKDGEGKGEKKRKEINRIVDETERRR